MKSAYIETDSHLLKSDACFIKIKSRGLELKNTYFYLLCIEAHKTSPFNLIIGLK